MIHENAFETIVCEIEAIFPGRDELTHRQLETHKCVLSTLPTDVLVLKHQAINIQSPKYTLYWTSFIQKYYFVFILYITNKKITFWKNKPVA